MFIPHQKRAVSRPTITKLHWRESCIRRHYPASILLSRLSFKVLMEAQIIGRAISYTLMKLEARTTTKLGDTGRYTSERLPYQAGLFAKFYQKCCNTQDT